MRNRISIAILCSLAMAGCLWTANGSQHEADLVANIEAVGDAAFPDDDATWTPVLHWTNGADLVVVVAQPSVNVGGQGPIVFVSHEGTLIANATFESTGWTLLSTY